MKASGWQSCILLLLVAACLAAAPATTQSSAATRPLFGKDLIVMDELVALYEPVAFDHRTHAQMAETWDGCVTCHHRAPKGATSATTRAAATAAVATRPSQEYADVIPACKSCHAAGANSAVVGMPSLKGAYHRQCLNCHRDWMDANACVVCHAARKGTGGALAAATVPTQLRDDIVGRMHKPIPEPKIKIYRSRFTPAAGANVLFRHDEHVATFGITCANCHRRDTCADCHAPATQTSMTAEANPLQPGRTWRDTHGPCVSCHQDDRCDSCHYADGKIAPPAFEHSRFTGQLLDKDHAGLKCAQCHAKLKTKPSCGDASCHKRTNVALPIDRPGPFTPATTRPLMIAAVAPTTSPATQPATRPTIVRIRRGGS
jgi:cytochrome c553